MTFGDELQKAKDLAESLFKEKSQDVIEAFEEETVLGNPKNLVVPDNENE